ncbi:SDR family oxidoreductase [Corynebacterium caspium]|uniref:SDR family oxidoreductase n=1 Tax=Corynebacterium caspium TaxID=234828 RepID=UPI000381514F|nr:sugar nucleotide-binding protein [Corynebacterium caspium]WKD59728.1 dTDP-4-dehydrorhamnose reductase [Corynebacterium caspium DSM 44850]
MKVVVTGAAGQLGRALALTRPPWATSVCFATRADLALESIATSPLLDATTIVINAAAYTAVDAAESHPEAATFLNTTAPGLLAERVGHLIQVSTDYVFGPNMPRRPLTPKDPTGAPQTVYGRTKLAGEQRVLAAGGAVVRTAWVYSGNLLPHRDFLHTMLRLAAGPDPVRVVDDQIGSPTYVVDLARALWAEAADPRPGLRHAVGAGHTSWHGLAQATFAAVGADPARVLPIPSVQYPTPAVRPQWSVLASDYELPHWSAGVRRAVEGKL